MLHVYVHVPQGDEDQRRAMMKSFVESNGTVLSTNWQEVRFFKSWCRVCGWLVAWHLSQWERLW